MSCEQGVFWLYYVKNCTTLLLWQPWQHQDMKSLFRPNSYAAMLVWTIFGIVIFTNNFFIILTNKCPYKYVSLSQFLQVMRREGWFRMSPFYAHCILQLLSHNWSKVRLLLGPRTKLLASFFSWQVFRPHIVKWPLELFLDKQMHDFWLSWNFWVRFVTTTFA